MIFSLLSSLFSQALKNKQNKFLNPNKKSKSFEIDNFSLYFTGLQYFNLVFLL
jgi:hypothetical protein